MIVKMAIAGIVILAFLTIALMPSPGNLLNPRAESSLTRTSKSTEAGTKMSTQDGSTSQVPIDASTQPVTETFQGPVYTNVMIMPENVTVTVNQTFSMEIWIINVTDMAAWQVEILWNKNILACIQAQIWTPPEWGEEPLDFFNKTESDLANIDPASVYNAWQFGVGIDNDYNATWGRYLKAECQGPNGGPFQNTFNGSIAIVTLTFQALQAGSTPLIFSREYYDPIGRYYDGMIIGDSNAKPMAHIDFDSFVEVQAP